MPANFDTLVTLILKIGGTDESKLHHDIKNDEDRMQNLFRTSHF